MYYEGFYDDRSCQQLVERSEQRLATALNLLLLFLFRFHLERELLDLCSRCSGTNEKLGLGEREVSDFERRIETTRWTNGESIQPGDVNSQVDHTLGDPGERCEHDGVCDDALGHDLGEESADEVHVVCLLVYGSVGESSDEESSVLYGEGLNGSDSLCQILDSEELQTRRGQYERRRGDRTRGWDSPP